MRGGRGTASRVLSVLGAVYSFGLRLALVATKPTKNVKAPKGKAPGRYLSDEEWARLGAAMSEARTTRPELTKWPFTTHKRTYPEPYAAFWKASAWVRSDLNPSTFSDRLCSTPQT